MRRVFIATVVFAVCAAPLRAELKVNTRMQAREVAGAQVANDMISAMAGPLIRQVYGGPEGMDTLVTIHEDGRVRTEYSGMFMGLPAGAVVIQRLDGTSVGFDPKARTWWKMVDPLSDPKAVEMLAKSTPQVSSKRTGEFATVAGLKAEQVSLLVQMPIVLPPEASQLPPQLLTLIPKEIKADGRVWVADAHAKYQKGMTKAFITGPLATIGLDKPVNELKGLVVRFVMTVSLLAGWEIETLASTVAEEDVPDNVFDVPAGFQEVPMPAIR